MQYTAKIKTKSEENVKEILAAILSFVPDKKHFKPKYQMIRLRCFPAAQDCEGDTMKRRILKFIFL